MTVIACSFNEFAQTEELTEKIDEHRTGCEIDADTLMTGYKQYDANSLYSDFSLSGTPEPAHTPSPVTDTEIAMSAMLGTVWENGCQTGRRDAAGPEQATLMNRRDKFDLLSAHLEAVATSTPRPTSSSTTNPYSPRIVMRMSQRNSRLRSTGFGDDHGVGQ